VRAALNRETSSSELPLNVVDLWFATLSESDFSLQAVLSVEELRRASVFRFDRDAANFVARRGILRLILATYTGVPPSQLSFTHNQFGKPALDGCLCNIRFSLSKSGELAVYAVARLRDLGVDLEHFGQRPLEISSIAGSFFCETQIAALNDCPADQKERMFLRLWTQLEAQGKARGIGIGGLNSASSGLNAFPGKCFSFTRSVPAPGYSVAVAVQGRRRCSLRTLLWSPRITKWANRSLDT
jgi:4'-phosphopantetheinyl transferase